MSRKLFEKLAKEHFILYFNGLLVVTNKFYREFKTPIPPEPIPEPEPEVIPEEKTEVVVIKQPNVMILPEVSKAIATIPEPTTRVSPLFKFIKDSQIPEKAKTQTGFYRLNLFSLEAEKVLIKILTAGYNYDILVAATKLYYKSAGSYPKNISNYLTEGLWQGCYEDMKTSLDAGTVNQHIKSKLDNKDEEDGNSRYTR